MLATKGVCEGGASKLRVANLNLKLHDGVVGKFRGCSAGITGIQRVFRANQLATHRATHLARQSFVFQCRAL